MAPHERTQTIAIALIIKMGPGAERRVEVSSEMSLGREDADITIPDDQISRRHARVAPAGEGVLVEDLGSTNGTWVNDARISEATTVNPGDTLRVGNTEIEVERAAVAGGTVVAPVMVPPAAAPQPAAAPPTEPLAAQQQAPYTTQPGPAYGPPPPGYGPPPGAPPKRSNTGLLIGLAALLALLLIGAAVWFFLLRPSPEEQIEDVLVRYGESLDEPEEACSLLTTRLIEAETQQTGDAAVDTCEQGVSLINREVDIEVNDVEVDGDEATAETEAEGQSLTFGLAKEAGDWRIDSLPAAEVEAPETPSPTPTTFDTPSGFDTPTDFDTPTTFDSPTSEHDHS